MPGDAGGEFSYVAGHIIVRKISRPLTQSIPAPARRPWLGIFAMLAAVFSFTVLDALAKIAVQTVPMAQAVWARYIFSFVLLLALLPRMGLRPLIRTRRPVFQIVRALLLVTATATMFMAVRFLPLADVYSLSFSSPIFVALLAGPLLGERVGAARWLGIVCGFIGVVVVIRPGMGPIGAAAAFPLLMALLNAVYQIMTRRLSATDAPLPILFFTMAVGALVTSLVVPLAWISLPWSTWLILAAMGGVGLIGQVLLIKALAIAAASVVAPLTYTQVVWAILIGYFVFGDAPDAITLIGAAIVMGSGIALLRQSAPR